MAMSFPMTLGRVILVFTAMLIGVIVAEVLTSRSGIDAGIIMIRDYTTEIADDPNGNFFSRNRGTGIVHLNRNGNPPAADRGHLRCDIPNASGVTVTLYVNIGEWFL